MTTNSQQSLFHIGVNSFNFSKIHNKDLFICKRFTATDNYVWDVCVTYDYVICGGYKSILIARLKTGELVYKIPLNDGKTLFSCCLSQDGKYLVSGWDDGIRIMRTDNLKIVRVIKYNTSPNVLSWKNTVLSVFVTPNNKYLVFGVGQTVRVMRLDTGKLVRVIERHTDLVSSVCVTSDNKYVISASFDNTVKIMHLDTGELIHVFRGHTGSVTSIAITSNNKYLVSGSTDNTICIMCLNSGKLVRVIKGHTDAVFSVCLTRDNKYILSGSRDCTIRITRFDDGKLVKKLYLPEYTLYDSQGNPLPEIIRTKNTILKICLSPQGHTIVAGCLDGFFYVFKTPKYILKRQWGQVLLLKNEFRLFREYPGLIRYIGNNLLLFL